MDQWRHFQDRLLPVDSGSCAVLDLWTPSGVRGLRHSLPSVLLQPLPTETHLTHHTHHQRQGPVKHPRFTEWPQIYYNAYIQHLYTVSPKHIWISDALKLQLNMSECHCIRYTTSNYDVNFYNTFFLCLLTFLEMNATSLFFM